MDHDSVKVEEAVLAVLSLTMHAEHGVTRVWKSVDWDVMSRLHERGFISDPRNAYKSVVLTAEGIQAARAAAERLFGRDN